MSNFIPEQLTQSQVILKFRSHINISIAEFIIGSYVIIVLHSDIACIAIVNTCILGSFANADTFIIGSYAFDDIFILGSFAIAEAIVLEGIVIKYFVVITTFRITIGSYGTVWMWQRLIGSFLFMLFQLALIINFDPYGLLVPITDPSLSSSSPQSPNPDIEIILATTTHPATQSIFTPI